MVYFSKNTTKDIKGEMSEQLGILITQDLIKYLRLPTINERVTGHTFQAILDWVDKCIAGWKSHSLSMAGCATLIQSTIATIPSYAMQIARLPRSLCDEVDKKARTSLWGSTEQTRKIHHVS